MSDTAAMQLAAYSLLYVKKLDFMKVMGITRATKHTHQNFVFSVSIELVPFTRGKLSNKQCFNEMLKHERFIIIISLESKQKTQFKKAAKAFKNSLHSKLTITLHN